MTISELENVNELRRELANTNARIEMLKICAPPPPSKAFEQLIYDAETKATDLRERIASAAAALSVKLSAILGNDETLLQVAKHQYVDGLSTRESSRQIFYVQKYTAELRRRALKKLLASPS